MRRKKYRIIVPEFHAIVSNATDKETAKSWFILFGLPKVERQIKVEEIK